MRNISKVFNYDVFRRGFIMISGDKEYVHDTLDEYEEDYGTSDIKRRIDRLMDDKWTRGFCVKLTHGESVIYIPDINMDKTPVMVHEITHACVNLLNEIGVDISSDYDEVLCYMVEYGIDQVTQWLESIDDKDNGIEEVIKEGLDGIRDDWKVSLNKARLETVLGLVKEIAESPSKEIVEELIHVLYYLPNDKSIKVAP